MKKKSLVGWAFEDNFTDPHWLDWEGMSGESWVEFHLAKYAYRRKKDIKWVKVRITIQEL